MNLDELYERIRQTSREEVVLEEIIRLGFWPVGEGAPAELTELVRRRGGLEREAAALRAQHQRLSDPVAALAAERQRRIEASRARRAERRLQRDAERERRAKAWRERSQREVLYLGEGVSAGLSGGRAGDPARVLRAGLPPLDTPQAVAAAIGIPLDELRWLTYHRKGATLVHYVRFDIPKRTGGRRYLSAPLPRLRRAQQWVWRSILSPLQPGEAAHGFVPGRSILTNAAPHAGRDVVINADLQDFFPTFTFRRVKGFFERLGYPEAVAVVLTLLVTEPPRVPVEVEGGGRYHVALGERVLPQGSCCSPALSNLLCWRLDRRLAGLARKHGLSYTRYADDLTLSGDGPVEVQRVLGSLRRIVDDEGLRVHPEKTRVLRRGRRQEVTGLIVNNQDPAVPRELRRELRAILHNARREGLARQNRAEHPAYLEHLRGRIAFVEQVQPAHGRRLREALERIVREDR